MFNIKHDKHSSISMPHTVIMTIYRGTTVNSLMFAFLGLLMFAFVRQNHVRGDYYLHLAHWSF